MKKSKKRNEIERMWEIYRSFWLPPGLSPLTESVIRSAFIMGAQQMLLYLGDLALHHDSRVAALAMMELIASEENVIAALSPANKEELCPSTKS